MEALEKHTFDHFSHKHPLELTISSSDRNDTCKGCNLKILPGKDYYHCKTCSFSLHEVCSNMPMRTRHPSHPYHYLSLLAPAPSANGTLKCKACGDCVRGFYYTCGDCSIYYHILCLAIPLSVALATHSHKLKMEFSPPFEFNCDLCDKPTNKGWWLYRCRFCEFDVHVSCAISNGEIDYGSGNCELLQLLVQGAAQQTGETDDKEVVQPAVSRWNERLHGPKVNLKKLCPELLDKKLLAPSAGTSPGPMKRYRAPSSPISEDATIPSYQFSDFCFSIDLLKSYTTSEDKVPESKDTSYHDIVIVPDVEARISHGNVAITSKNLGNGQRVERIDPSTKPINNPRYNGPENWLNVTPNEDKYGQSGRKIIGQGYESRSNFTEQSSIATNTNSGCWNLLSSCYSSKYKKGSKSFKNRGL